LGSQVQSVRSLDQWLAYQTQVHPQAIDLGLDRLRVVLDRLHWRQPEIPVITVAGTNGKGSVSAYCAAIMGAAGLRVGTFTSPHLRHYQERIRVHDRLARCDELVAAFEKIEAARGSVALTFFEFNALAALLIFDAARLDAWVLEIGMGGRLDAVNVVDPDVAVVTSIGLDHQEYLGDTLEAIAKEKAGIFRAGRTAVIGGREPSPVLESAARAIRAPLKRLAIEYNYILDGAGWLYRGTHWDLPRLPAPALLGDIQFTNAATAIAALEEIAPRLKITAGAVTQGLSEVRLMGRFQVIKPAAVAPTWILDVAHNPDAARVLARNLSANPTAGRTLAVCGILADKDAAAIADILDNCIDQWWCVPLAGARGRSGEELADQVRAQVAVTVVSAASVAAACAAALEAATPRDRVLVFGSFHTVGPALDWLEEQGLLPRATLPEYTSP
jgi:dihydrofolate synthase / folylpolyglutamate synthase